MIHKKGEMGSLLDWMVAVPFLFLLIVIYIGVSFSLAGIGVKIFSVERGNPYGSLAQNITTPIGRIEGYYFLDSLVVEKKNLFCPFSDTDDLKISLWEAYYFGFIPYINTNFLDFLFNKKNLESLKEFFYLDVGLRKDYLDNFLLKSKDKENTLFARVFCSDKISDIKLWKQLMIYYGFLQESSKFALSGFSRRVSVFSSFFDLYLSRNKKVIFLLSQNPDYVDVSSYNSYSDFFHKKFYIKNHRPFIELRVWRFE